MNEIHTVASLTVDKMEINTLESLTNCSHIVVGIPSTISTVVCCSIITLCFMTHFLLFFLLIYNEDNIYTFTKHATHSYR